MPCPWLSFRPRCASHLQTLLHQTPTSSGALLAADFSAPSFLPSSALPRSKYLILLALQSPVSQGTACLRSISGNSSVCQRRDVICSIAEEYLKIMLRLICLQRSPPEHAQALVVPKTRPPQFTHLLHFRTWIIRRSWGHDARLSLCHGWHFRCWIAVIYGFSLESLSVPPPPRRGAQVWSMRRCSGFEVHGSSSTNFSKNWPFLAVAIYEAPKSRAHGLTFKLSPVSSTHTFTTARFHHVSQQPAKNHLPTVAAGVLPGSSNCTFLHHPVRSQAAPPISLSANDSEINCGHKCSRALKNYISKSSWRPQKLPQKAAGSFAPCSWVHTVSWEEGRLQVKHW